MRPSQPASRSCARSRRSTPRRPSTRRRSRSTRATSRCSSAPTPTPQPRSSWAHSSTTSGKLSLPAELLLKAEPLDEDEWALVREHPEAGARIVAGLPSSHTLLAVVRHHHERVDGRGYPRGLRGREIPAAARIVGACDAYAAMTQHRPYRASLTPADAIAELRRNADAQFDAEVVAALVWLLDAGDDDYRLARSAPASGGAPARGARRARGGAAARSGVVARGTRRQEPLGRHGVPGEPVTAGAPCSARRAGKRWGAMQYPASRQALGRYGVPGEPVTAGAPCSARRAGNRWGAMQYPASRYRLGRHAVPGEPVSAGAPCSTRRASNRVRVLADTRLRGTNPRSGR